ncbi:polymer-forming cytoskeletal protein [Paenibacillus methanolicus]|uniref:Cytoskeletal protein CcmA (Bactofilin family) n=1 Tax=Paenibacillus methanolicus TaxID=582686 RepID=A0A5S5BQT1_9BACL|nr:polymer-forming cytoskeletal protein [Paenibacillus methanolicus]TYP68656.1 cytoskeletal protein CcmA (bactofilin family) [Paenibacillus methanolicus]
MMLAEAFDLALNGISRAAGGAYRSVKMEGVCKIDGDVKAEDMAVSGVGKVYGGVEARTFVAAGRVTVAGPLTADRVRLEGQFTVRGGLYADKAVLDGALKVEGNCEAEEIVLNGWIRVGGMLNAGRIDIGLIGASKAQEIGGSSIEVKRAERGAWAHLLQRVIPAFDPALEARMIEGDEVRLEATAAAVVRGDRVVIGAGCSIGRVEYKTELIVHPNASVKERVRV